MIIRAATPADIPEIQRLANEIWWPAYKGIISVEQIEFMLKEMYSLESLKAQFEDGNTFIMVIEGSVPVGFASFSVADADREICKIYKLYVLPSIQGRGTGKSLIAYIADEALKKKCKFLELNVNRSNPAFFFYKKIGFEVYQIVDIPYHQFILNDYVMRRQLNVPV